MADKRQAVAPLHPLNESERYYPANTDDVIPLLSACFALVRPTGMSDSAADEWLAVAATDLTGYPYFILETACGIARRHVTHHAKLVPAIFDAMGQCTYDGKIPARQRNVQALPKQDARVAGLIKTVAGRLTV